MHGDEWRESQFFHRVCEQLLPLRKMTKKQAQRELQANGFTLVREYDRLPWQHLLFFQVKKNTPDKELKN